MASRRAPGLVVLCALVGIVVLNASFTRGYVRDGDSRPLIGADIVLADPSGIVATVQTNEDGYFRVAHLPFVNRGWQLLICADRRFIYYDSSVSSALIRSSYGIGAYTGKFPDTPESLGWRAPAPRSCPTRLDAAGG